MDKLFSLKNLIWIDATAALLSGVIVLMLKAKLSLFFNFPESLLTTLGFVSLSYALFSFYLAQQKSKSKRLLKILVIANLVYAIVCIIIMLFLYKTANLFGVLYLILESSLIAILALVEWRQIKLYFEYGNPNHPAAGLTI